MNPPAISMHSVYSQIARTPALTKGEKSRATLLAATCVVLDTHDFSEMRVADICAAAKVSHGLFYHYFDDKGAATRQVVRDLLKQSFNRYQSIHRATDPYLSIFEATLFYVSFFEANLGLLRALLSRAPELAELDADVAKYNHLWNQRMAKAIVSPFGGRSIQDKDRVLASYALGGMIDELLRQLWIVRNPNIRFGARDPVKLAETIAILWFRAALGSDPSESHVADATLAAIKLRKGQKQARLRRERQSSRKSGQAIHP